MSKIIVTSIPQGVCATANHLSLGQYITLEENHIICNKRLSLSFKKESFSDDDVIRMGHGETLFCSSYLELTKTDFKIYEYTSEAILRASRAHGLELRDFVNVTVCVGYSSAQVTIETSGGIYQSEVIEHSWSGRNGKIFAFSKASDLSEVSFNWTCSDYEKDIWLFGDSYFNPTSELRWTSYLLNDGYTQYLLSGYPGRNTASALKDFTQALTHGKPKYAVWCLGMNDEDSDTEISESYLCATKDFLDICQRNGITPILSTIPCVPERNHAYKNNWVKSLGVRYVDFAKGVGGEETGSSWYDGMLYPDNVHPDALGAKALYTQFIKDFPEILIKE